MQGINDQMLMNISYADEYIRAFFEARNEFAKYWCTFRGYDINNLTPEQQSEIQHHHDYARPSLEILPWGHLTQGDEKVLRQYSQGCDCAIELGTLFGRGAAILSKQAKYVVTIDNYQDPNYGGMYHTVDTVRYRLKIYQNIMCCNRSTNESAMFIRETINNKFDFLFIDADHSYEGVKKDFEAWFPLMESGAYILFHDYHNHEGVKKYVKELHNDECDGSFIVNYETVEIMDPKDGSIVVFRKK